ncbi:uncharacterized protein LOC101851633 [Aplysia californica]|uniref:Uncharacterized protein LOC101851633 n=1 Tax=Aplysia californica TaxID=6500 RepID=A0ABM0JIS4_APLCA|nr:uncharacterized protein LOC101851633 [Aplysia californica]
MEQQVRQESALVTPHSSTETCGSSGASPSPQRPESLVRPPDVRPKELPARQTKRRKPSASPPTNLNPDPSTAALTPSPQRTVPRRVREHKLVLDSVAIEQSFLSSAAVRAVEINLRDYALPSERALIESAVRVCVVRSRRYPNAAQLLECIIDANFEEENLLKEFSDICSSYGGVEDFPFVKENWTQSQGQNQGQYITTDQGRSDVRIDLNGPQGEITKHGGPHENTSGFQAERFTAVSPVAAAATDIYTGQSGATWSQVTSDNSESERKQFPQIPQYSEPSTEVTSTERTSQVPETSIQAINRTGSEVKLGADERRNEAIGTNKTGEESTKTEKEELVPHDKTKDETKESRNSSNTHSEGAARTARPPLTRSERNKKLRTVLENEREYLKGRVTCSVCNTRRVEVIFLPCSHLTTCSGCARRCKKCPLCDRKVAAEAKTFIM